MPNKSKAGRMDAIAKEALRDEMQALREQLEVLTLPSAQFNHARGWLESGPQGGKSDDALIKVCDAKGNAICTLNAGWLRALTELPQPERQAPTWEPNETGEAIDIEDRPSPADLEDDRDNFTFAGDL